MTLLQKSLAEYVQSVTLRKLNRTAAACVLSAMLGATAVVNAQSPVKTPTWTDFYGGKTGTVSVNGLPARVGTVVEAFDNDGILCGQFFVKNSGKYGFMPVYGDDDRTADVDEGPKSGETVAFQLAGLNAAMNGPDNNVWNSGPTTEKEVNLSITDAVFGLETVQLPADKYGTPGETVIFTITFRNTGNVTDFYTLSANSLLGWTTQVPAGALYVKSGLGNQTVLFRVTVPPGALNLADQITFTLTSGMDPSLQIAGSVNLFAVATDVDGDNPALPNAFTVEQNYPNPFNPTTTIPFKLSAASRVTLTVVDILGRVLDRIALGALSAGEHRVTYDASQLSSGVYFYRVEAGNQSITKRMALLK